MGTSRRAGGWHVTISSYTLGLFVGDCLRFPQIGSSLLFPPGHLTVFRPHGVLVKRFENYDLSIYYEAIKNMAWFLMPFTQHGLGYLKSYEEPIS